MNTKFLILLIIVLSINTIRYGTYLLEGATTIYNWVLFGLNILALISIVISNVRPEKMESGAGR